MSSRELDEVPGEYANEVGIDSGELVMVTVTGIVIVDLTSDDKYAGKVLLVDVGDALSVGVLVSARRLL